MLQKMLITSPDAATIMGLLAKIVPGDFFHKPSVGKMLVMQFFQTAAI